MDELDPEIIKATQLSLGKYIKRPPLTEKLLRKPPFRFLHDIFTTVLKTTGFFEGLFDDNELVSDNVKDRDSKISFLNKAISIISVTTGKTITVKPSKIVAGQEPTKTNELLQCLALALDNNLSSHEAVKKYKEGKNKTTGEVKSKDINKPNKKNQDIKKSSSKSQNITNHIRKSGELLVTKKDNEKANDSTKKNENGSLKNESRNKNTKTKLIPKVTSETKLQSQSKTQLRENKNLTPRSESNVDVKLYENGNNDENFIEGRSSHINTETENIGEMVFAKVTAEPEILPSITKVDSKLIKTECFTEIDKDSLNNENLNVSKSIISKAEEETVKETIVHYTTKTSLHLEENLQKSLAIDSENFTKPQPELGNDARLTPPLKNDSNIIRSASVRPSSSRPGAPRPKEKFENLISDSDSHLLGKVNIIAEHEKNEEEDDSSIVIVDNQESLSIKSNEQAEELNLSRNEYGHLVQQILDSQKEFSQVSGKTEIEWQFGAQKATVAQHQEIELLRYNIQALTRVTNPLGKLLDHIQEDVEVMRQELQQWSSIYEEITKEIQKENALSEDFLISLRSKLKQLESDIQEKNEKINDLKVLIYKNSSRIEKLLSNGGTVQ